MNNMEHYNYQSPVTEGVSSGGASWPCQQVSRYQYLHTWRRKTSAPVDSLLSSPIPAPSVRGTEPSPVWKKVGASISIWIIFKKKNNNKNNKTKQESVSERQRSVETSSTWWRVCVWVKLLNRGRYSINESKASEKSYSQIHRRISLVHRHLQIWMDGSSVLPQAE